MKNSLYDNLVLGDYEIEIIAGEHLQDDKGLYCYLALASALKRDLHGSYQNLSFVQEVELSDLDRSVCLEAKAVVYYFSGNFNDVEEHAKQALELSQRAFFARYLLARLATWKRDFGLGIEYYRTILEFYPQHSSTLLDLAEALIASKGNYREILGYVAQAKVSLRRTMYLVLIPLGKPLARLLWAFTTLALFSIPKIGTFLFGLISILIVLAGIITLIRVKWDALIISRLVGLQGVTTLVWLLTWIASTYW